MAYYPIIDIDKYIWGIDVSQYQDNPGTLKKPDLKKAQDLGCRFVVIRSSYGVVKDRLYEHFAEQAQLIKMPMALYHYMDYYSHTSKGLTSTAWGQAQGEFLKSIVKINPVRSFVDVESSSVAQNISLVWGTAMTIMDNIFARVDPVCGAMGIYASTGWLPKFFDYQKWRECFAANYNPVSETYIRNKVREAKFANLLIWQATSSGDIDGDFTADGYEMGMETNSLDIDVFMKDEGAFKVFFKVSDVPQVSDPVIDIPDIEPGEPMIEKKKAIAPVRVRTATKVPTLFSFTHETLTIGEEVEILERVVSGKYTWVRIGYHQWCCEKEGDRVYLQ